MVHLRSSPARAIAPVTCSYSAFGAEPAARRPANPITLCDGHGVDFATVTGQILMAVHTRVASPLTCWLYSPYQGFRSGYRCPAGALTGTQRGAFMEDARLPRGAAPIFLPAGAGRG